MTKAKNGRIVDCSSCGLQGHKAVISVWFHSRILYVCPTCAEKFIGTRNNSDVENNIAEWQAK